MSDTHPTDPWASSAGIDLQHFVLEENVRLYRKLLSETHDEQRRAILDRLLVEAAAALQRHGTQCAKSESACPPDRSRRVAPDS